MGVVMGVVVVEGGGEERRRRWWMGRQMSPRNGKGLWLIMKILMATVS